jgi:SAM-dependent methyltransferase
MKSAGKFDLGRAFDMECYYYFTSFLVSNTQSKLEVDFFCKHLHIGRKSRVLDLPCGYGRHTNLLAGRAGRVTGVDSNNAYLDRARAQAAALGVDVDYRLGDMRTFADDGLFDAAIMVFTSFGIFDHNDNVASLAVLAAALGPGGRLCIDFMNPEPLTGDFRRNFVCERGDDLMVDRLSYREADRQLVSNRIYVKEGQRRDVVMSNEIFSFEQISSQLKVFGVKIEEVYADFEGRPLTSNADKMVVIGRKILAGE